MTTRLPASLTVLVCLAIPSAGFAQTLTLPSVPLGQPVVPRGPGAPDGDTPATRFAAPKADGFWAPFTAVPGDFVRFMSMDTLKLVGIAGAGAAVASRWDGHAIEQVQERMQSGSATAGNVGGKFLVQIGASFGVYSFARATGNDRLSAVGGDLLRAHILSQGVVQAGKFMTRRPRPDGSNNHSLPSGHTASAFATASVLQRHYGWKVGAPAYGFGAYVAASRMSANKHNLSDVMMGAAIGIAAGHTVTIGRGKTKFEMGVAPTIGGAAITFSKKQ
jgi:membrane-associated phospholipid phosphatase